MYFRDTRKYHTTVKTVVERSETDSELKNMSLSVTVTQKLQTKYWSMAN